jgi:predicted ATPase/DNA-binding SARP family transcriptional activator
VVRVAILGPFEVHNSAGVLLPVAGARLRDLVIRLALTGGKPVSTSALAEAIWGDEPPADLANALQTLVSRARRVLGGAEAVEQSAAGYRLAITPDDVDALRFERLVADGAVEQALALWRGPALQDAGEFAAPYARRLHELKLDATLTRLERDNENAAELEALAAENPLNEKVAALLMRTLAATGRQAKALAVYDTIRGRLADELGINPAPDLQAVHLEVLRGKVKSSGSGIRTNLRAQLTSFVGREDEVTRLRQALDAYRLVTLVGPGGAGKTRLASEVVARIAAKVADGHQDGAAYGVWMAELASVTDAVDVPKAVLGSIGWRESRLAPDGSQRMTARDARTRLLEGLADAPAVLVLDNCEHVIDACAHLADTLLAHSPRLRIVATSREPLGITGESLFVVPPLDTDPAMRLFAERARAVSPGFTLDEQNLSLVADIVRRLDGLPLAIELAAARLRTLPLSEISRRLNDRFRLLTGGSRTAMARHRTLRAVVEWSWELLTPAERLLAERFSVFPAGATPSAVAEVCEDLGEVDELLSSLVDKSLLQPADGGIRLRMLETIREYGAEKLAEHAEAAEVRRRHATYYCDLMIESGPKLLTRDQLTWLRAVHDDRDNILAALRYWCDAQDASRAITLAMWLSSLSFLSGNHADIAELIAPAVAVPGQADPGLRTVAEALYVITQTVNMDDLPGSGQDLGFPGLTDRVETLDVEAFPLAALLRPIYAIFTRDTERARRYLGEALQARDEWLVAATCMASALLAENDGDMDALRAASAQALEQFRALGERWGLSTTLQIVGDLRMTDGDLDGAAAAFAEASRLVNELGSRDDEAHMRMRLAQIAARRGDLATADDCYEAALMAAQSDGTPGDVAMVSGESARFAITVGNVELARSRNATARQGLELLRSAHPGRNHLAAGIAASDLLIALADADLPLAREHAAAAYQAAVATNDMPMIAVVAGALACLAHAAGESERAAEMLGARVPVRGSEDASDLMLTRLGSQLRAALGAEDYARAYDRGKALDRAEALALFDPAGLSRSRPSA